MANAGLPSEMRRFNVKNLKPKHLYRYVYSLVGGRGSGKSVLLEQLMYLTQDRYDFAMAMTITKSTVDMLEKHIPRAWIYTEGYDYDKFDEFMKITSELAFDGSGHHCLVVLDDLAYDSGIFKTKSQKQVHMNGRHQFVTVMDTFQYAMDIPCFLRGCVDILFAFLDMEPPNQRRLYEYFFKRPEFPTLKIFSKVFVTLTSNYGILVKIRDTSGDFNKCVQYYRAKENVPKFRLGWRYFHEISNELVTINNARAEASKAARKQDRLKRKQVSGGENEDEDDEKRGVKRIKI